MTEALLISVADAAALLGVSDDLVYALVDHGELPCTRLGRRRLVPRRAIDDVVARVMADFDADRLVHRLTVAVDPSPAPPAAAPSRAGGPGGGSTGTAQPGRSCPP
jgi:excisionase family DNA binding protein